MSLRSYQTPEPHSVAKNKLDAIAFPTVPKVAIPADPDSSSLANFLLFIQNTDPDSDAGIPGVQIPVALGASSNCRSALRLTAHRAATATFSLSGWPWRRSSAGFPRPARVERKESGSISRSALAETAGLSCLTRPSPMPP
jgi:hypothetical protein